MNGIEFHRRKRKLAQYELAKMSKVTAVTIHHLEKGIDLGTSMVIYIRLAEVLGCTVDDLLADYDPSLLSDGDRHTYNGMHSPAKNIVDMYRITKNLTFELLAVRLGIGSREGARKACNRQNPSQRHLQVLADYEGISRSDFEQIYALN